MCGLSIFSAHGTKRSARSVGKSMMSGEMSEASESTGENVGSSSSDGDQQNLPHPWPYLKELFEIVGSKNDSWRMHCKLCEPKNHVLLAFKNSPSNLKKHVEVSCFLCYYYINSF